MNQGLEWISIVRKIMPSSRLPALILALFVFGNFSARAAGGFGFNYWPGDYGCNILTNANWTAANKSMVKSDLDQMSSLGAGVLRLMFWPQDSGFQAYPMDQGGGAHWTHDFNEERNHLVELLGYCQARSIKVIISFGNDYQSQGNGAPGHRWWMNFYGNTPQGFTKFLGDTRTWINGFVNSIEGCAYASTVLYYDYENEYCSRNPYAGRYAASLYDTSGVPAGKRGYSVLRVPEDAKALKSQLGPQRPLNFVEFHSYPAVNPPANADIESCHDQIQAAFPNSTILLGEFGRRCDKPGEEMAQQTTTVDLAARARRKGIPYFLHWMLWDNAPPFPDQTAGWGYRASSLKDVYGGMCQLLNLCANPDMEQVAQGIPAGWSAGGSGNFSFSAMGPNNADAATNRYYARLQRNAKTGEVWMNSPRMNMIGAGHHKKLYLNCYVRSNMSGVSMCVKEYNSIGGLIAQTAGPACTPGKWSWNGTLRLAGPWSITLQSQTRAVIVSIGAKCVTDPSYLDVDAVSVWAR